MSDLTRQSPNPPPTRGRATRRLARLAAWAAMLGVFLGFSGGLGGGDAGWARESDATSARFDEDAPLPRPDKFVQSIQVGLVEGIPVARNMGWLPVRIEVATRDTPVKGRIEAWFHSTVRDIQSVGIDLPEKAHKEFLLYIKKPDNHEPLVVELIPNSGDRESYSVHPAHIAWFPVDGSTTRIGWGFEIPELQTIALVLTGEESSPDESNVLRRVDAWMAAGRPGNGPYGESRENALVGDLQLGLPFDSQDPIMLPGPSQKAYIRGAVGPPDTFGPPFKLDDQTFEPDPANASSFTYRTLHFDARNAPGVRDPWWIPDYYHTISGSQSFGGMTNVQQSFVATYYGLFYLRGATRLLPDHPFGYDTVDAVIVDGQDPDTMTGPQRRALRQWIDAGGILILCAGGGERWRGSWLDELSPAVPGDAQPHRFARVTPLRAPLRTMNGLFAFVSEAELAPEAVDVQTDGDKPILARRTVGSGVVTYVGFSLLELARRGQFIAARDPLLTYLLPSHRPQVRPWLNARNVQATLQAERQSATPGTISTDFVFFVGLAFLLISVPLNAYVCRRLRRPMMVWPMLCLLCVVGSVGIWAVLSTSGIDRVQLRQVHWMQADLGGSTARATSLMALGSSYPRRVDLVVDGTRGPAFYFTEAAEGYRPDSRDNYSFGLERIQPSERALRFDWRPVPGGGALTPDVPAATAIQLGTGRVQIVGAESNVDMGGPIEAWVDPGRFFPRHQRPAINLRNGTRFTIRDILLYEGPNALYRAPDMEPGSVCSVEFDATSAVMDRGPLEQDHPELFDRLRRLRTSEATSRERRSILRLLFGIKQANDSFFSSVSDIQQRTRPIDIVTMAMGLLRLRFFPASDRPDYAYYLSARIEGDPLAARVDARTDNVPGDTFLLVRIPILWLREEGYSLNRWTLFDVPPPAASEAADPLP